MNVKNAKPGANRYELEVEMRYVDEDACTYNPNGISKKSSMSI
jgi:hypothetical protein